MTDIREELTQLLFQYDYRDEILRLALIERLVELLENYGADIYCEAEDE